MSFAFISHSKQDITYINQLKGILQLKGVNTWIDERINAGEDIWLEIERAIQDCAVFIIVMTSNSKQSRWVNRELSYAFHLHKPIVPILLEGGIWPFLAGIHYENSVGGLMPKESFYLELGKYIKTTTTHKGKNISFRDLLPSGLALIGLLMKMYAINRLGNLPLEDALLEVDASIDLFPAFMPTTKNFLYDLNTASLTAKTKERAEHYRLLLNRAIERAIATGKYIPYNVE